MELSLPPGSAVVAGDSGGGGQAICKRLAAAGSSVVFSYHRNRERADQLVEEPQQSGVSTCALPCDNWKGIESGIFLRLKGQDFDDTWLEAAKANTALRR